MFNFLFDLTTCDNTVYMHSKKENVFLPLYRWLGVSTYLIFLFFIEVILLNLLIAQMSNTFSTVQGDAQRSVAITKARTIIRIERAGGLSVLVSLTIIANLRIILLQFYDWMR